MAVCTDKISKLYCWEKLKKLQEGGRLQWTSISSMGSRNTPSCLILQKPGARSGSYEPVGPEASLFSLGNFKIKVLSEVIEPDKVE